MADIRAENRLYTLISNSGMNYEKLVGASTEVIIFGSRAVGVHRPDSDLDVLLVDADVDRPRVTGIDFVMLRSEELASSRWLGSELASHIAAYGTWIKGDASWRHQVHISDRATMRKRARILGLLTLAPKWWSKLHPVFQTKYRLTIRRELQRLGLMRREIPVPPTHTLDLDWDRHRSTRAYLVEVAGTLALNPLAFDLAKACIESPNGRSQSDILNLQSIDSLSCFTESWESCGTREDISNI